MLQVKIDADFMDLVCWNHFVFQPGDGTRYDCVLTKDPYDEYYVICNNSSLWRYYRNDYLKFLCGNDNEYTRRAIFDYLEARKSISELMEDDFQ